MKIVCYGDSNTWGYDPRGPYGSRYDVPWPAHLAEKADCTVINLGENGREIPAKAPEFPADTDLLIIMLGTNDLLQFWTPDAATEKMAGFLKQITGKDRKILLLSPPTMQFGHWVEDPELIEDSKTLARLYETLSAEMGIMFADAGKWNIPLAFDGIHLTEEGHALFGQHLYDYLLEGAIL